IEYEKCPSPPLIFGGSYFNIIRAIIFAIVLLTLTISVPTCFSRGKFLIKLVVIFLVTLGVHVGKGVDTFKSFNIYFDF
ncbi:uncharacterized protein EV154DRAFT_493769, partial [Mucor mucedo]|uniref:uncharacterized protein n=1 Tax=Mucor mucedo TaxID=29922 RepID=UPI00221F0C0B